MGRKKIVKLGRSAKTGKNGCVIVGIVLLWLCGCQGAGPEGDIATGPVEPIDTVSESIVVPPELADGVAGLFNPATAEATAASLRDQGGAVLPELITALQGGRGNYQGMGYIKIIEIMGDIGDARAVPALITVSTDAQAEQYHRTIPWVVNALRAIGDQRCVPALEQVHQNIVLAPETRLLAGLALEKLTGRSYSVVSTPPLGE